MGIGGRILSVASPDGNSVRATAAVGKEIFGKTLALIPRRAIAGCRLSLCPNTRIVRYSYHTGSSSAEAQERSSAGLGSQLVLLVVHTRLRLDLIPARTESSSAGSVLYAVCTWILFARL